MYSKSSGVTVALPIASTVVTSAGIYPIVYPSGFEDAIASNPTPAPAPGLFSTTTDTPNSFSIAAANNLLIVSDPPPAANGQISVICFSG